MPDTAPNIPGKTAPASKTGRFKQFFYHPNFNVVSGLFGIVGVLLAVYFYAKSIREPRLMFYVSPTRTPIVQKGNLENFSVTFQGRPINSDLSTATIQIWNDGKQPIRGEDILTPITVSTLRDEPVYQITAQTTRDVVGLRMLSTTNQPGTLALTWNILEQNDGFKLQIIYGGDVNVPLSFNGVVVGQKGIVQYIDRNELRSNLFLSCAWIVLIVLMWLLTPIANKIGEKVRGRVSKRSYIVLTCVFLVSFLAVSASFSIGAGFIAFRLFNLTVPHPPFPS